MTESEGRIEQEKEARIYEAAQRLHAKNPDWVTFFREVFGANGMVRRTYPTVEAQAAFERTETYLTLQQMLTRLRQKSSDVPPPQEPTKVITVRIPRSLHEALRKEAHDHQTSMNKLCISKLLQIIDSGLVPSELRVEEETAAEESEIEPSKSEEETPAAGPTESKQD